VKKWVVVESYGGGVVIEAALLPGETPAEAKARYDKWVARKQLMKLRVEEELERIKKLERQGRR